MIVSESGKYKRRDGVVSNRVLSSANGKDTLMIVWEDKSEFHYFPNGRLFNPRNTVNPDSTLDVVEELHKEDVRVPVDLPTHIPIPYQTLSRWLLRVKRCENGGFPTNVALEMETFIEAWEKSVGKKPV